MKKLGLLLFLFVCAAVVRAQSNIVKSLERNVPGQGKVTIHQDSRIEALLGTARTGRFSSDLALQRHPRTENEILFLLVLSGASPALISAEHSSCCTWLNRLTELLIRDLSYFSLILICECFCYRTQDYKGSPTAWVPPYNIGVNYL